MFLKNLKESLILIHLNLISTAIYIFVSIRKLFFNKSICYKLGRNSLIETDSFVIYLYLQEIYD
jgi:hypothetical protein